MPQTIVDAKSFKAYWKAVFRGSKSHSTKLTLQKVKKIQDLASGAAVIEARIRFYSHSATSAAIGGALAAAASAKKEVVVARKLLVRRDDRWFLMNGELAGDLAPALGDDRSSIVAQEHAEIARNIKERQKKDTKRTLLVVALVATILFGLYVGICAFRPNKTVWLVNGTEQPYDVAINDLVYSIEPQMVYDLPIDYGTINVQSITSNGLSAAEAVAFDRPFMQRCWPFAQHTLVINPDRKAELLLAYITYTSSDNGPEPSMNWLPPMLRHEFKGIDYVFEDAPDTISTEGSQETRSLLLYFPGGAAAYAEPE